MSVIRDFRARLTFDSAYDAYRMPELIGLTVAQADYEWTHRFGLRSTVTANPYNAKHNRGEVVTETWEGFTGALTVNIVNPDVTPVVANFTGKSTRTIFVSP